MTIQQKIKENEKFLRLKRYLETGAIGIMDASISVIEDYRRGSFAYDEAEVAIRLLAKVKPNR